MPRANLERGAAEDAARQGAAPPGKDVVVRRAFLGAVLGLIVLAPLSLGVTVLLWLAVAPDQFHPKTPLILALESAAAGAYAGTRRLRRRALASILLGVPLLLGGLTLVPSLPSLVQLWNTRRNAARWLSANAVPLATVEAGHGFADLRPVRRWIGNARIVSLGEATHGTREFFQFKHRMLEFLVQEMGFTAFAIEAQLAESEDINEYVLTGKGDPAKALRGLQFWTWDTEEVLELIRWMQRYNADPRHPRKLRFYGFDMQMPARAARLTLEYLRKVDSQCAAGNEKRLQAIPDPVISDPRTTALQAQALVPGMAALAERLNALRAPYIRRSSVHEWTLARQHLRIVEQSLHLMAHPGPGPLRDGAMADNVRWILQREGPQGKIVLWAHNGHVATEPGRMGSFLRKEFGSEMVVFGFTFNQGAFRARDDRDAGRLKIMSVGPAPWDSVEAMLAASGRPLAAVRLSSLPEKSPVRVWFDRPPLTRNVGAGVELFAGNFSLFRQKVTDCYDALFFIEKTTASRPNP